jgi:class 3 adenylate cyclase
MVCPGCFHVSAANARFCSGCGAPLGERCPACGHHCVDRSRFCDACGALLGAPPRFGAPDVYTPGHLAARIRTSRAALEGERKQVTVLFADLADSTAMLADRDPEEARQLLDPVLDLMMQAVHQYEGTVNQVLGDGIMALFGAPLALEDHAVRACYAALRIQEEIARHATQSGAARDRRLQLRVGLNSGDVVVRSIGNDLTMDYSAIGECTHLAARMEQLAPPGAILVTGFTARLTEGWVDLKPRGESPVKGFPRPVEIFELVGASPRRSRVHAAAARGLTRFVGRETELAKLAEALEQAGGGHGQVVAVVGEAGVGKSRLLWEFLHGVRAARWLVLETTSLSYGRGMSYLPVIGLLKDALGGLAGADGVAIRQRLGSVLGPAAPARLTTPILALLELTVDDPRWATLDPPERRRRTIEAVKHVLLALAREQPTCVVVEDLHWIDGETQAVLDRLVEALPAAPLLLLVSYRPEYEHGWGGRTYYTQLRIDALRGAGARSLADALLGTDASLDALKPLLLERTEGNPFFLEECVHNLMESGVLAGGRTGGGPAGPAGGNARRAADRPVGPGGAAGPACPGRQAGAPGRRRHRN